MSTVPSLASCTMAGTSPSPLAKSTSPTRASSVFSATPSGTALKGRALCRCRCGARRWRGCRAPRRITYSSPWTSTSKRSSGLKSTVSPIFTVRTCGPTATASAQVRRRLIWAVAGMRMPARDLRSPSVGEICTMTRSKSTEMGCLSAATASLAPFFLVDVGTLPRYRTKASFQVRQDVPSHRARP